MKIINKIVNWGIERSICQQLPDPNGFISNIVEELSELKTATKNKDWGEQVDAIDDIVVFCLTELPKYGVDPKKALKETFKEINSRTGEWSEELQKWQKYTTDEAKALWYKADYNKALSKPKIETPSKPKDKIPKVEDTPMDGYGYLKHLGLIGSNAIRDFNVGASNYAQHVIQPWAVWQDYNLNPWDADIIKRVLRTKETDGRILDYEKIIHICQERIRQLTTGGN